MSVIQHTILLRQAYGLPQGHGAVAARARSPVLYRMSGNPTVQRALSTLVFVSNNV